MSDSHVQCRCEPSLGLAESESGSEKKAFCLAQSGERLCVCELKKNMQIKTVEIILLTVI